MFSYNSSSYIVTALYLAYIIICLDKSVIAISYHLSLIFNIVLMEEYRPEIIHNYETAVHEGFLRSLAYCN